MRAVKIEVRVRGKVAAQAEVGRGFFARLALSNDLGAARELRARVLECQAQWGESACVGPVSLSPNRLGEGVRVSGFERPDRLSPVNPPHYARLLEACGAQAVRRDMLFEVSAPANFDDFARMARRFGATAEMGGLTRAACAQIARIAGENEEQMARALGSLKRPRVAIARVRGDLAGYMIALPNGRLWRIAEARVAPAYHRRGAVAALLCALGPGLGPAFEAGVVDGENRASAAMAERAGGRRVAEFRLYRLTKI